MKYLIKTQRYVGDIAIDISILNAIARLDNECHIEVLAKPPDHVLLSEIPHVSKLHVQPNNKLADLWLRLKLLCQRWDAVLITRDVQPQQLFYRLARASFKRNRRNLKEQSPELKWLERLSQKRKSSQSDQDASPDKPEMLIRLSMLDGLLEGWDKDVDPTIHFNPDRVDKVLGKLGIVRGTKVLTIAPGASIPQKIWDKDNFVGLVNIIKDRFDIVIIVGSDAEKQQCEHVARSTGATPAAGMFDLLDTCALLSQSSLHIGNDSGLGHVAAGVGTSCAVIGDAIGLTYKPLGQHMLLGDVKEISVERAVEFLKANDLV